VKLLDTNVVLYTLGEDHPLRSPCEAVMARALDGKLQCTIDVELLQEVLHFYHGRRMVEFGRDAVVELIEAFPLAIPITWMELEVASQVLVDHPLLDARDAVHAAVVFEHRLEGIISADRAFDGIAGLTRFDPKELAA
jgi:predicted nucleic acid-binding protein